MPVPFFDAISWVGVAMLMLAHASLAFGKGKRFASTISAAGALLSAIAAAGMGLGSLFLLNAAWFAFSLMGAQVSERSSAQPFWLWSVRISAALSLAGWTSGPDMVAWLATITYLLGWMTYSLGAIRRLDYFVACLVTGMSVVPALLMLGAPAFALNEAFGVCASAAAVIASLRIACHSPEGTASDPT